MPLRAGCRIIDRLTGVGALPTRRLSINRLIELFPDDRDQLAAAADRVARLSSACGCTEGAIAMTIAMVLVAAYYLWPGLMSASGHRIGGLWTIPFVVAAAGIGKLIGIGVARLRLVLVYQRLRTKYQPRARHVYLHEVGRPSGHRV